MSVQVCNFTIGLDTSLGTNVSALVAILTELTGADGYLEDAKVRLFTNNLTVTPALDLTAYTAPTWGGYTVQTTEWDATARPTGLYSVENVGAPCDFLMGADGTGPIYGAVLTDNAESVVLGVVKFDPPVEYVEGQEINLVPRLLVDVT